MVVGMHLEQGYCVRFPAEIDGEPLETWEDWSETDFITEDLVHLRPLPLSKHVLREAREALSDAEDGCHLHLYEEDLN
jgi:hypothetical protein